MARDTLVLTPNAQCTRLEALADEAIQAGNFVDYTPTGFALTDGTTPITAELSSAIMLVTENISIAGDKDSLYAIGENVFAVAPASGTLVNARAVDGVYTGGQGLELGLVGELRASTTGNVVAVVPSFGGATIAGDLLLVQIV